MREGSGAPKITRKLGLKFRSFTPVCGLVYFLPGEASFDSLARPHLADRWRQGQGITGQFLSSAMTTQIGLALIILIHDELACWLPAIP